ncbi:unnamed protein product [Owenia fusiformis]|uniref:Vacuolar protein sorting-associated protein 54 n=1 Tax=Owenia fusiformis TaxID=6347 RepID=A0A8J1U2B0_OWEFU|nr:unnamed protein product [Owenia fusiformis]
MEFSQRRMSKSKISSTGSDTSSSASMAVAWKKCSYCHDSPIFKGPRDFCAHLREYHCTKEGGSYVCRYGSNKVCPSLPLEGVSDRDYEDHVARDHVAGEPGRHKKGYIHDSDGGGNRTDNTAASTPTVSEPSIVTDQYRWTVFNSKVNLPALLNDPRLTRRQTDFFTKTWGEGFEKCDILPSPYIPVITKAHFDKYLHKISKRLKKHNRYTELVPNVVQSDSNPNEVFPALKHRQFAIDHSSRAVLEQVPKLFMTPGFSLTNPDTFSAVFPWTQVESSTRTSPGSKPQQQSSKLLQEKMSHYLDLVEVQIAKQISMKSDAFFTAISSQNKLQDDMLKTCAAIKHLRDKIHKLNSVLVEGPLKIMKLTESRSNHIQAYNKLKLMATVHQTQPTIQMLLSTNEFVGAIDLISTTQEVLTQELAGIHSFRHLGSQLAEMEKLIDKMMQADFIRYATADLNRPLDEGSELMEEERLVAIVFGLLRQHKFNFIDVYREEACTAMKAAVKQTVVQAVSEAEDIDTDLPVGSLADQMRLLNFTQWMTLLGQVFVNLLIILNRVKAVCSVIITVLNLASSQQTIKPTYSGNTDPICNGSTNPFEDDLDPEDRTFPEDAGHDSGDHLVGGQGHDSPKNTLNGEGEGHDIDGETSVNNTLETSPIHLPGVTNLSSNQRLNIFTTSKRDGDVDLMVTQKDCSTLHNNIRDLLCQVCDHAHDRCVKVIVARAKHGFLEKLSSSEFVTLSREIEEFVKDCELLCGRKSMSLRGSLQSQANRFVTRFHEERKTKLSLILDNERWKQADVPEEFQDLVNFISEHKKLALPEKKADAEKSPSECLLVNSQKYTVVGTVLMLLKMVIEYCQCIDDIPTIAPDMLTRVIELLKIFNSRTCQLVLGAGALQLVGLKTITTKNLALASRCLQLVVYYLPMVRNHFETRLQGKQQNMMKHFDSILKDYNDHIQEISNKLVAILEGMLEAQLSRWEVKAPMPSPAFRGICKQMSKFHEAVVDLLPMPQVKEIFAKVHELFKERLHLLVVHFSVRNDGGPQHGLVSSDLAFYTGNISKLEGLQSLDYSMDSIWDKT